MVTIDVNSGTLKGGDQAETILKTNLEACDEIARQLRLRNIGGLLVIDFIDMRSPAHRDMVYKKIRNNIKDDRARTRVYPISRLGLMEISRQRDYESLRDTVFDPCPYCMGRGKVKSAISMSVEIQRRISETVKKYHREKDFSVRVIMHPSILARMKNEDSHFLSEIEKKYGAGLSFRADPGLHMEEFKLIDPQTGAEFK
jgi:Ribonuclease G/E